MGWGTWAGFGDMFNALGENLGYKRLDAQNTAKDVARREAEAARQEDEFTFQQQRRPGILTSDRLTNESLGERILGDRATTAQTNLRTQQMPEEHRRAGVVSDAQARAATLAGNFDEKRIGSYDQELKSRLATDAAQRVASGANAAESGTTAQLRRLQIQEAERNSRPLILALDDVKDDRVTYRMALNKLTDLRGMVGKVSDPEVLTSQIRETVAQAKAIRQGIVNTIKARHREYANGADYKGDITIEDMVPDVESALTGAEAGTGDPVADAIREMAR